MRTAFFAAALVAALSQSTAAVSFDQVEAFGSHDLAQVGADMELALVNLNDISDDFKLSQTSAEMVTNADLTTFAIKFGEKSVWYAARLYRKDEEFSADELMKIVGESFGETYAVSFSKPAFELVYKLVKALAAHDWQGQEGFDYVGFL